MGFETTRRYSAVAMALHWVIAGLIFANIGLAWDFNSLHGLAKDPPVQLHKSIGISILVLSLARLAWRLLVPPPPLPPSLSRPERATAPIVQGLFYVIMITMPLSGWALSSASPLIHIRPIQLYGLVHFPAIGFLASLPHDQMKAAHDTSVGIHSLLAKLTYLLIGLHVAAALRHQFLLRDGLMSRMAPRLDRR